MTYQIVQWLIAGAWLTMAAAPQAHEQRALDAAFDDAPFMVADASTDVLSP